MIKYYCDICERELEDKQNHITYRIRGYNEVRKVYCIDCLALVLGEQDFTEYMNYLAEKERRRQERGKSI